VRNFVLHNLIKKIAIYIVTITLLCLGGITLSATQLNTPYIPRAILFTPPNVMAIKVSPDSHYLAYVKAEPSGVMNLYVCARNQCNQDNALKQLTHFTTPEIYQFFWTDDSKNIVFLQDTNGSKSYQLYSVNVELGTLRNNTKDFKNITAKIFKVSGHRVAVGINDRNPKYHDIFILDTNNDSLTKIFENNRFSRFIFDDNLNIVFKEEIHDDGSIDIYKDNAVYMHFSPEDAFHSRLIKLHKSTLYYLDSRNSDTTWFKSVDLNSGKETKLAHNSKSDINEIVFVDHHPFMYSTNWLTKEWHRFGAGNFDLLQKTMTTNFEVTSQSKLFWIIRAYHPQKLGASFYLYNLETKQLTPLFIAKTYDPLAKVIPFEFKTRDGLTLTAYITLPNHINSLDSIKNPVPLIVFPHGGPFQARDSLIYNPYAQWLASRGYAVLNVNFRLSSGLGKNLVNAGNGEWGRKALFDLIDGIKWCIDKGITTKTQVGIMGASYGGYATLAGLSFTPEEFAVGVSVVGPSSLITVMQKVPTYWDFPSYPLSDSELFFTKGAFIKSMGGNPDTEEGQQFLASRSPLNFASHIERPLLLIQGDHDPIVTKEESQQIFDKLKQSKKKVWLLSFSDEGHQFRRYANMDVYLAYSEKWLHDVLGGRFEPINPTLMKESSATIQKS
jgi:dipeptidyl aminopeptidase/acylaminoacyl peptidase